ncbi:hypothetical protein AGE11_23480 [Salmonella enterica subsp. enterica serovar Kentucky]|nr:hypothetical protein AGE11_23480 [Salmonella enterica subsp. enterica serovar Kentucky]
MQIAQEDCLARIAESDNIALAQTAGVTAVTDKPTAHAGELGGLVLKTAPPTYTQGGCLYHTESTARLLGSRTAGGASSS